VRPIAKHNEALQLLRSYLGILTETDRFVRPELQRVFVTHIHDLLASALGATQDAAILAGERGVRSARLRAIMFEIGENLDKPELSISDVAMRHRVTPRYVQKLFSSEGTTFTAYVLERRLMEARRMLGDPRFANCTISELAYRIGFGDLSYFTRVFRRKHGASPSDIRAMATRQITEE
jgi:AraC-like DNA-binding protein